MKEKHTMLDITDVEFDLENPRIKDALEKYGDDLNEERIYFALRSATGNGNGSASSFASLKDSIRASGGVMTPISVIESDGKYVCIDGNTRLAIYRELAKENTDEKWLKIKATVLENAKQHDIERIRVSAHLVGARQWPAYEKARYLHYLHSQKFMDYGEMVALCGGNKLEIQRQIDAYHDMNEYYRDVVSDDSAFKMDRFSGFVELQKPKIKESIFSAGFSLKDFGEWIRDGKIRILENTRSLPTVLRDPEARERFISGGPRSIEDANRLLDLRDKKDSGHAEKAKLGEASLHQLATTLTQRIKDFPLQELTALQNKDSDESVMCVNALETLSDQLHVILKNVAE